MTTTSFMRQEIEEIPQAAARLLDGSATLLPEIGQRLASLKPRFLTTVARGSSDHAAAYLKYATELVAGLPVASIGPSVASIYGARLKLTQSAAICISQSGKSPDIVAMAEASRAGGAFTIAITNTPVSPLATAADAAVDIRAGVERSVAATKTFVNSALAGLAILAHAVNDRALIAALHDLPLHLEKAVACDWSPFADALAGRDSLFVLGRGPSFAFASEAALKLKETCAIHAEAYSAAEVMHGPMALIEPGFPVLALVARDAAEPSLAEAADALLDKGGAVFATSARVRKAAALPFVATGHPLTDPICLIVSFYAFVEDFARRLGLDPDQPRNLRKVTETV